MSIESAIGFIQHSRETPELQQKVAALSGRDALGRLVLIAREAGYLFTEEEYRAAVVHEAEGELDDAALDELVREVGMGRQDNHR